MINFISFFLSKKGDLMHIIYTLHLSSGKERVIGHDEFRQIKEKFRKEKEYLDGICVEWYRLKSRRCPRQSKR